MPRSGKADTAELVARAQQGDAAAVGQLLDQHRQRLTRMVTARIDDRLAPRIDPSDVVQDALAIAAESLPKYLDTLPLPFYVWLRRIAWRRLLDLHRRHLEAAKRDARREAPLLLSGDSAIRLAGRLGAAGGEPLERLLQAEVQARVRTMLRKLPEADREVLLLRHAEDLSYRDAAAVLQVTEQAAKKRYVRALERLRKLLEDGSSEALP